RIVCIRARKARSSGGSYSGRTTDSDSVYLGSNPSPPAKHARGPPTGGPSGEISGGWSPGWAAVLPRRSSADPFHPGAGSEVRIAAVGSADQRVALDVDLDSCSSHFKLRRRAHELSREAESHRARQRSRSIASRDCDERAVVVCGCRGRSHRSDRMPGPHEASPKLHDLFVMFDEGTLRTLRRGL